MAGMANRFRRDRTVIFKVGERELHVVEYRRDDITGQENIYVDGNIVLRSVTIAVWLVVTLATGRTIGDHAVQLRFEGGDLPSGVARFLRFAGGIGLYLVLFSLGGVWSFLGWIYLVISVILVFATVDRRGLPGIVSGQWVVDAREGGLDASTTRSLDAPGR